MGGVHHEGVVCLLQGRDGTVHILLIARDQLLEHVLELHLFALALQLQEAALGAHLGAGGEVDFDRGIRQHDRADVAAVHDDVLGPGQIPLHLQQVVAHALLRRDAGGHHRHFRRADLSGDVLSVEEHVLHAVLPLDLNVHVVDAALDAVPVLGADAHEAHVVAHGAVDRAGVDIMIAQLTGQALCDGALPGAAGAVDGNADVVHLLAPMYRRLT